MPNYDANTKYDWFFDLVLLPFCLYGVYSYVTTPRRKRAR